MSNEDFAEDLKELKELAVDNHKYTTRRYDIVSLVFSGFGIYGNFEVFKLLEHNNVAAILLMLSSMLWLINAFSNLYNIKLESDLNELYISQVMNLNQPPENRTSEYRDNSVQLSQRLKSSKIAIFRLSMVAAFLTIIAFILYYISM